MSMTQRILTSWRRPRLVMRTILAEGKREDRALVYLMAACFIAFMAQWPGLSRAAFIDPSIPLDARLGGALLGTMFLVPLFAYGLAAVSHLVAKLFGGKGDFFSARMALFWAMLVISPLMLFHGLLSGFLGPGAVVNGVGLLVLVGFLVQWSCALRVAEAAPADLAR